MTKNERIILQAVLGSDPIREVLSMIRLHEGSTAPTALFETNPWSKVVEKWRKKFDDRKKREEADEGIDF